jgi:dihydropteroate synthase
VSSPNPDITVRIIDAALARRGGPVQLCLRHLPDPPRVADALPAAVEVSVAADTLVVTAPMEALRLALTSAVETAQARQVERAVERAVDAWLDGPDDLPLGGRHAALPTGTRTVVQGVLNVTPDSFSDGGTFLGDDGDLAPAIAAGLRMAADGAGIIDVGGESTRPGAEPVSEELELARTVPVVRALAERGIVVSIDTTKAAVARAAVDAGAVIVNDVSAGRMDPELLPTVADLGVAYVLMHMQGTPRTMQRDPTYTDVVAEVFDHLAVGLGRLRAAGVDPERVMVDPGIGFGKTLEHNLALLHRLRELTSLGRPVLVGASRKSFIGHLTATTDPADRLEGSLAAATLAVAGGARIVRVHDVVQTVRSVAVADAVRTAGDRR